MSLHPQPWPEPSDEVVRAVMAIYAGRRAPMPVAARDELGELFADAEFAAAFAGCGPEGWSPGRLMLVTVLQAAEGLTDRQAAEAVRDKLVPCQNPFVAVTRHFEDRVKLLAGTR